MKHKTTAEEERWLFNRAELILNNSSAGWVTPEMLEWAEKTNPGYAALLKARAKRYEHPYGIDPKKCPKLAAIFNAQK